MHYTITQPVGQGNELAFVNIENSENKNGFSISVKPLIAEVVYGCESITHRYNAFTLVTPYDYKVRIKRKKRETHCWFPDNPVQASRWYKKQRAKFGLGCAAVTIDSRRKVLTIHVTSNATVEKSS